MTFTHERATDVHRGPGEAMEHELHPREPQWDEDADEEENT